jgi:hypothetical protein
MGVTGAEEDSALDIGSATREAYHGVAENIAPLKCARSLDVLSGQMRAGLLLLAALAAPGPALAEDAAPGALPPESSYVRTAHAARRSGPIEIDGRMDEAAWLAAPLENAFTQVNPDEGKPATVHTAFRVLWDDEYLYFGAICDDTEPPTATLSRRDRFIEGDSVQFDLDTTLDRQTAYHFQVYAAGQQLDGIHFNDTDMTTDWDAAWDSAVARTGKGWSVEMRIPLRVMRIPVGAHQMGFNVYRVLSRRHEEDQWRFRPNGRPGDISRLGLLEGIDGIHPVRSLELRPFLATKLLRNAPAPGNQTPHAELQGGCATVGFDPQRQGGICAGLDFRYNLASDLALVGTLNPDFGQVEADQRILNLSTFETFFPEKRPFFLEGLDLFKPSLQVDMGGPYGGRTYQIFYSRRIGRATPLLDLDSDQTLVYTQPSVPVLGAVKLTGTLGGASVGFLDALEPRVSEQVLQPDRGLRDLRAVEARNTAVLRVRSPSGEHAVGGITATAVDPLFTDGRLGLGRTHAHVGAADLNLYTADRSYGFSGQVAGSLLTGNNPRTLRDGTFLDSTASGYALSSRLYTTKENFFASLWTDELSPGFNVNDLGYMQRANLFRAMGYTGIRDPHPGPLWQRAQLMLFGREVRDAGLHFPLERDAGIEGFFTSNSFWFFDAGAFWGDVYQDDRELADGTPIERQAGWGYFGFISTDSRRALQLQFAWFESRGYPRFERSNSLDWSLVFRPLPQLDGRFDVSYNESAGTIRQIRTATDNPPRCAATPCTPGDVITLRRTGATDRERLYILAAQQARSISATLRATYSFTPFLTLQAYAQLFTAGISYDDPLRAVVGPGRRTVTLGELTPARREDLAPDADERQVGLNVNLILRWEWRTGSTLYLVYAHQSSNDLSGLRTRLDFRGELDALNLRGVTHGDTFLVKVDLLSAL